MVCLGTDTSFQERLMMKMKNDKKYYYSEMPRFSPCSNCDNCNTYSDIYRKCYYDTEEELSTSQWWLTTGFSANLNNICVCDE